MREGVSPTRGAKIVDLRPVPATYQTSRAKKRKPPPGPSIKFAPRQGTFASLCKRDSTLPLAPIKFAPRQGIFASLWKRDTPSIKSLPFAKKINFFLMIF